jgi:hypothetical protein
MQTVSDFSDKCTPARRLQGILTSAIRTLRLRSPAAKRLADRYVLGARQVYGHSVSGRLLLPMRRTSALVNAEFVAPPTFAPSKCEPATRQTGSTLMATQLNRAILDGADLRGADLRGADLRSCQGLTAEQLQGAILDHRTRLPRELQYLLPTPPHTPCQKSSSCGRVATH